MSSATVAEGERLLAGLVGSGWEAEVGDRRFSRVMSGECGPEESGTDMVADKCFDAKEDIAVCAFGDRG